VNRTISAPLLRYRNTDLEVYVPHRLGFLFSAKGVGFRAAWGSAPGMCVFPKSPALKARFILMAFAIHRPLSRAFSAGHAVKLQVPGACPRLEMRSRPQRSKYLPSEVLMTYVRCSR
jgi:hypothetical protein